MATAGVVGGNRFSGVGAETGVGAVLNSTRWAPTYVRVERRVEAVEEMTVYVEPRGHAVVMWVEGVKAIARGRDRAKLAAVATVMAGVVVMVVVQRQQSGEVAAAKGVSSSVEAVEEAAREAAAAAEAESAAGAGVEARRTEAALGVVEVEEVPTSVVAAAVATPPAMSARSTQTQS